MRIGVIGGGIAGLATATLLARAGADVDLWEKNPQLGGRAGIIEDSGFTFDTGPSWYLMPEVFAHFFNLCGTSTDEQLDMITLDPGYRIFDTAGSGSIDVPGAVPTGGHSPAATTAPIHTGSTGGHRVPRQRVLSLAEALEPGSSHTLDAYLDEASDTYRLALDSFLYTTFTGARGYSALASARVLSRLPRLPGLLAGSLGHRVERTVEHPLLRQMLGYPAVFLGTEPRRAPALYQLMSHLDLVDGVQYPLGGMHTIITAIAGLARAAGVRIHTGAEVVAVRADRPTSRGTRGSGRRGSVHEVLIRRSTRRSIPLSTPRSTPLSTPHGDPAGTGPALESVPLDFLVAAGDQHHFETRLLPGWARTVRPQAWGRTVPGGAAIHSPVTHGGTRERVASALGGRKDPGFGALTLMLGVRGRLPELTHHNLFFTRDWDRNFDQIFTERVLPQPASAYVCAPSVTDPSVAPADCENLFVLVPVPADEQLRAGRNDVEDYADGIVDAIGARIGTPDLRERTLVRHLLAPGDYARSYYAWSGTALGPANTLFQSAMFRGRTLSRRVGNLAYAGTYAAPGVGLPMALISAENVLKALLDDRSTHPLEPAALRKEVLRGETPCPGTLQPGAGRTGVQHP